ncbi:MAG: hypothetical protein H7172_12380 [Ferruginibacter sp.]|nr:hypothetical protein [Rhodoferax sp.]
MHCDAQITTSSQQRVKLVSVEAHAGMLTIAPGWSAADAIFRSPILVAVIAGASPPPC